MCELCAFLYHRLLSSLFTFLSGTLFCNFVSMQKEKMKWNKIKSIRIENKKFSKKIWVFPNFPFSVYMRSLSFILNVFNMEYMDHGSFSTIWNVCWYLLICLLHNDITETSICVCMCVRVFHSLSLSSCLYSMSLYICTPNADILHFTVRRRKNNQ